MRQIPYPAGTKKGFCFLRHRVQTDSQAHPASYSMGSVEVKNAWSLPPLPPTSSWRNV